MAPMIKLLSSDQKEFDVEVGVVAVSKMLNTMIKDLGLADEENPMPIPLSNVDGPTLEKVLEWCRKHKDDEILEAPKDEKKKDCVVPEWDNEFLAVDTSIVINIVTAANFLDIPDLLDYSCQTLAEMFKDKEPEALREKFNIENDFTKEEYEKIEAEAKWCIDPIVVAQK